MTFEQYVERFKIAVIQAHEFVDYSQNKSIRKHNYFVDKYRKIANKIYIYYPDQISEFSNLQDNDNFDISLCCAICIVELMSPSLEEKNKAIDTIKKCIEITDDISLKHGLKIWLTQHKD